ncbi:MAG: Extracellular solute-binding protein family 5 [Parcubacteria group bacterium Gr01-1014_56]|nr:MAG: Extracellular solute-binding protein family 5 [Parcubacteria group bacterium Gr01-1014_56]
MKFMRRLWRTLTEPVYLPLADKAEDTYRALSKGGRGLFVFLSSVLVVSAVALIYLLNAQLIVAIPGYGGGLEEGIVGSPRLINPVLATSDADRDLSILVYSGLLRATPGGDYKPDLAESYSISPDGREYTFVIRKNVTFHDKTPVTAEDILFTVSKIQDPALKSPLRASWSGVVAEVEDPQTVRFTLKSPYAPFVQNLTLGILPKHLWQNVSVEEFSFSDLNASPIGSGPFRVLSVSRTPSGIPSSYQLRAFDNYALGKAYFSYLTLKFYQSEAALRDALERGDVEAASGLSPTSVSSIPEANIMRAPLNRVFGIFFNQNQSELLRDIDVRRALEESIDRATLVEQVLQGYGTALEGPIPPDILPRETPLRAAAQNNATSSDKATLAKNKLIAKGWKESADGTLSKTTGKGKAAKTTTLAFSLSTGNVPELRAAAEYLRQEWSKVGAAVDVKIFDQGDLSQNVIRPRKYDALLFGEVVGRELDLFAFWHSSQRNDPGLNIALYANSTADKILEQLREIGEEQKRLELYNKFAIEVEKDIPAIFLYAPDFVYSIPKDIVGVELGFIETPSDRFLSAPFWHRETDYVWPIFGR